MTRSSFFFRWTFCGWPSAALALFSAFVGVGLESLLAQETVAVDVSRNGGVIAGLIYDAESGAPLPGVRVAIEGGASATTTSVNGRFRLEGVNVGSHVVLLSREGFQSVKVTDVVVSAGEPYALNSPLARATAPAAGDDVVVADEFTITAATSLPNSAEAFAQMRRNVPVSIDTMSAAELGKFVGSDVSDVLIRMPGVSVASRGSFAVIRGLGERYNSTTLNGVALPSSDPERQSVELDQFPTKLLDGLVVYKNFAADQPGNLTGGGVEIKTISFPTRRALSLTLGVSADEGVFSGDEFLTYAADGSHDAWAQGAKDRLKTSEIIEFYNLSFAENPNAAPRLSPDAEFPFTARPRSLTAMPRGSFHYGDTFAFGGDRKLGVLFTVTYDSSRENEEGRDGGGFGFISQKDADGNVVVEFKPAELRDAYSYTRSTEKVHLGALAGASVRFDDQHQIRLTGFTAQVGSDRAEFDYDIINADSAPYTIDAVALGIDPAETVERFRYRLRYRERNLSNGALAGWHYFPGLGDVTVEWTASFSSAYQEQPDQRFFMYGRPFNEVQLELRGGTDIEDALGRFWNRVEEEQPAFSLQANVPLRSFGLGGASLKVGGSAYASERKYREASAGVFGPTAPLVFENPEDASPLLTSNVLPPSSVDLTRDIDAGFLTIDAPLTRWLRVNAGVRAERTRFTTSGFGLVPGSQLSALLHYINPANYRNFFDFVPLTEGFSDNPANRAAFSPSFDETVLLPAMTAAVSPTRDLTLRASFSETLARPSMRELASYYSFNDEDKLQIGNAFLQQSSVQNLDFRAEYFFRGGDLAAVSLFTKRIKRPIEKFYMTFPTSNSRPVESWLNNPGTAKVRGVEVELRKNLGSLSERFVGVSVGGNATLLDAEIVPFRRLVAGTDRVQYTEKAYPPETRRLYDQPTWLVNADFTYEISSWGSALTLAYFASDRVLTVVDFHFDQYRESYDRFDFTWRQRLGERLGLKLTAKNLFDPMQRLARDPDATPGVTIVDRKWRDGRSFSLTATYDF